MFFKIKAWMIYIIGVAIIPILWVMTGIGETGFGFYYDFESATASVALYGGIILGIYYLYKRGKKKSKNS